MNYIVHGEEQYQARKAIDGIIKTEIGTRDDMNTVVYHALQTDTDTILADAQTIPFFTEKKCIIVDHATFFSASNDTQIDVDRIIDYLEHPMDSTIMIFSGAFAKLDTRKKVVKKAASLCKVRACNPLTKDRLPTYVKEQLQARNLKLDQEAFRLLCEYLPLDNGVIIKELEKLALYGGTIDGHVIKQLVTRSLEDDGFALVNAVVEKNMKRCFQIWEDLQVLNIDPIYLIALISSQFHLLYRIKCALLQGMTRQDDIASALAVHPYRVKLALPICQRLPIDELLDVLRRLAELDQSIKSGKIDKKVGFELFLLKLKGC